MDQAVTHIFSTSSIIFSADLNILDCQAWVPTQNEVLRIDKGHEQFRVGRLCLMSFEHFKFQLATCYVKCNTKPQLSSCSIFSTHKKFRLFQTFACYALFLLCTAMTTMSSFALEITDSIQIVPYPSTIPILSGDIQVALFPGSSQLFCRDRKLAEEPKNEASIE